MSRPRLLRDTALYAISSMATKLIGALLLPLITRLISPAQYGLIDLLALCGQFGLEMIVLGTDYVIALYYHDEQTDQGQLIGTIMLGRVIFGALVLSIGVIFSQQLARWLATPTAQRGLLIALIGLPFSATVNSWLMILRQAGRALLLVSITVSKVLATALLTVGLLLWLPDPLSAYFLAILLVDGSVAVGLSLAFRSWIRWPDRALTWLILRKGIAFFPRSVYFILMTLIARQILLHWGSLAEVGLYGAANKISYGIWIGITAFSQAWLAYSMAIAKQPDAPQIYARYLERYVVSIGTLVVGLALLAPEALALLTTSAYLPAAPLVGWQALSLMAVGALVIVTTGLNLNKETLIVGRVTVVMGVVNVGLAILLVPWLGGLGVALAAALDQGLVVIVLYHIAQRYHRLPFRGWRISLWLGQIVLAVGVASWLPSNVSWRLLGLKLLILSAYGVGLWISGGLNALQLRAQLQRIWQRRIPETGV